MTLEEANKILDKAGCILTDTKSEYWDGRSIGLDDEFTIEELEAILFLMRARQKEHNSANE